ncbi:hypothetical protein QUA41_27595 [Microcoleus sp. Pol11C1]|uniref:hypothetical protein n=1 Tax=unclassified Microcoleus TaxID=2642155 RepID=UPI002FD12556
MSDNLVLLPLESRPTNCYSVRRTGKTKYQAYHKTNALANRRPTQSRMWRPVTSIALSSKLQVRERLAIVLEAENQVAVLAQLDILKNRAT